LPHTFQYTYLNTQDATTNFAALGNNPAALDGDGLADTPPHPQINDEECRPFTNKITINGVQFDLPRSNIMSYYQEGCTLSTQQVAIVRSLASNYMRNGGHLPSNQGLLNPIEADALTVTQSASAPRSTQDMSGYMGDGWNGNDQLFIGFSSGGSLTLRVNVATTGNYQVMFYGTMGTDYGIVQCSIDGIDIGVPIDAYGATVWPTGPITLGTTNLSAGNHSFKMTNVGRNSASAGYSFGIDCLELINLGVATAPVIRRQPLTQTMDSGYNATLSIGAVGYPLFYQWLKNGTNVAGATNAVCVLNAVTTNTAGIYSVIVSNSAGSVTSSNAQLSVVTVSHNSPFRFEGESTPVDEWYQSSAGAQDMTGFGSGWSGNAQLFGDFGAVSNWLTIGMELFKGGSYWVDLAITKAPDYGKFQCYLNGNPVGPVVDSYASTVRTNGRIRLGAFNLPIDLQRLKFVCTGKNTSSSGYKFGIDYVELVDFLPPGITNQPQPQTQTLPAGSRISFSVGVTGDALAYQWRKNGTDVPGATNTTCTINFASTNDNGAYSVMLSNSAVAMFSSITNPIVYPYTLFTLGASNSTQLSSNALLTITPPPTNAPYRYEGELMPVDLLEGNVAWSVQDMTPFGTGWSSNAQMFGDFTAVNNAITLGLQAFTNGWFFVDVYITRGPQYGIFNWYWDGVLVGSAVDGYAATVRTNTRIRLNSYNLSTGIHELRLKCTGKNNSSSGYKFGVDYVQLVALKGPSISLQPQGQTVLAGNSVTFDSLASGDSTLYYQWRKDGLPLAGAVSPELQLFGLVRTQAGGYTMVVTNVVGSATSSVAGLRVLVPQRLGAPQALADGRIQFLFGDQNDGSLYASNAADFAVQATTNLAGGLWATAPGSLVFTNGKFLWIDTQATNFSQRFYRVLEQ
jgi:hypothetical protein